MPRLVVAAAAALVLLTAPASAQASPKKHKPCPTWDVVAESRSAKLYITITDEDGEELNVLRSCMKRTRERLALARWSFTGSSSDNPAPQYWLTGRYAATNQAYCDGDPFTPAPCQGRLKVWNLRARKLVSNVPTGDRLLDFEMTARGTVGMIHGGQLTIVHGFGVQVLDTAAQLGSMAYAAQTRMLYWTGTGGARSAPLR